MDLELIADWYYVHAVCKGIPESLAIKKRKLHLLKLIKRKSWGDFSNKSYTPITVYRTLV